MTAILMVLIFVLSVFMGVQTMLRDTISGQQNELDTLTAEVNALANALGLEQSKSANLENQLGTMQATLSEARNVADAQSAIIAQLSAQNAELTAQSADQAARIASFEAQVASLLAARDAALAEGSSLRASLEALEQANAQVISEREALQIALASARDEIDLATEQARLAAARREAMDALIADLQAQASEREAALSAQQDQLSAAEEARLVDAAALDSLREKLQNSQTELTAMTLALEAQRKEAEETLTLLAAAQAARDQLEGRLDGELSEAEKQAALLAQARAALSAQEEISAQSQQRVALLNAQIVQLRGQLSALQDIVDTRVSKDAQSQVQIDTLTSRLNAALAQVAAEEKARAALEAAERQRLEEEARKLENYRSEFFGRLREILGNREGVRVVGDRFVFSSEVLFAAGSADLGAQGRQQIARVAGILAEVAREIPPEIDWVIRVDGHTDKIPLLGTGEYADNWELSQARALSVVRYMSQALGFPADRLLAAGFGEFQPIAAGDTPDALAQNRRIELKLTEK